MHKLIMIIVLAIWVVAFLVVPAQAAQQGPPLGTCPPGFALHPFMEHIKHHGHHIGLAEDLNQDGYICVRHLFTMFHVHMDNVLP